MAGLPPKTEAHTLVHGTCVAIGDSGILLLGPPGAGKSDLALRLIDQPGFGLGSKFLQADLVSDDQVQVTRAGKQLVASPPVTIAGMIEVRGLAIVTLAYRREVTLKLCVRLTDKASIERLPDLASQSHDILGLALPVIEIDGDSASAPARIRAALGHLALV